MGTDLKAKNTVKYKGEYYYPGDVINNVDNANRDFLIEEDAAEYYVEIKDAQDSKKDVDLNIDELTEDQINDMKQSDLAKVASALKLDTPDKKADTLRPAILDALGFGEDVIDLDKLDDAGLRELAEAEEIEVPEDADEETLRDIIEQALDEE